MKARFEEIEHIEGAYDLDIETPEADAVKEEESAIDTGVIEE
jgi:hypothetical protein